MAVQAELIRWDTSLEEAQKRATLAGKAMLIDFSAAPE
jgi:hypothetical protein